MVVLMAVTVVVAGTSICGETATTGLCCIYATIVISLPVTAAMAVRTVAMVRMAKTVISTSPVELLSMMLRRDISSVMSLMMAKSSNSSTRYAQPGEPMQEQVVVMELKMLADVGLVGFPNAGKSTLVNAISSAHPKIAGYPFTTLEPSVGVVRYRDNRSFVMADIPGIIEGASEGKGLGLRFLRHIERNALLLFMIPGDTDDILHDYEVLLNELATYNPEMLKKRRILAITKADLLDEELIQMLSAELPDDLPCLFISSVTGYHITELKDLLWRELEPLRLHESAVGDFVSDSSEDASAATPISFHSSLVHADKNINDFEFLGDLDEIDEPEVLDDIEELDDLEYVDLEEEE